MGIPLAAAGGALRLPASMYGRQLAFPLFDARRPDLRRFVPGPNAELLQVLRKISVGEGEQALYLWGPPGTGKTHLLQAGCLHAVSRGLQTAYVSFADPGLSWQDLDALSSRRLVALDGLDRIAGEWEWEFRLLALYERLREQGGTLLAAAGCGPRGLSLVLEDLRSRLCWGLVYRLRPLAEEDRVRALRLRAQSHALAVGDEVMRYLLSRAPRDMHSLFALMDGIAETCHARKCRPSIALVKEQLAATTGSDAPPRGDLPDRAVLQATAPKRVTLGRPVPPSGPTPG
ncbi:MAG: DnaA regulatory inactivator Hda [Gammaproteobacteria bacterium]|nr:DnaA regulatory inactivator Hda [Gammaproteobacteria bacterium]